MDTARTASGVTAFLRRKACLPALLLVGATTVPAWADIDFTARTGSGPIKAAHSGMCLTVPGANPAETVPVVQQPCTGSAEQTWRIQPAGSGFSLVNGATGLCMDSQATRNNASTVWQCNCSPRVSSSATA